MPKDFLIGVVGNCAAGKTTLVRGLVKLGYRAINIPQEHSVSPRFWRRLKVNYLVMLSCTLASAKQRRTDIAWGQDRLDAQATKLADAQANCQLNLPTDHLDIHQVLEIVVLTVEQSRREQQHAGENHLSEH